MADRYIVVKARSQNSGTRGRCISSAGGNHIVMDDADYHGGPNEAITAAEAFLSGITACGALMLERLAHEDDIPLQRIDVAIEALATRRPPPRCTRSTTRCECASSLRDRRRHRPTTWSRPTSDVDRSMARSPWRPQTPPSRRLSFRARGIGNL